MIRVRIRNGRKIKRWIERLLLVAGVTGIAIWAGSIAVNTIWQDWEAWRFDHEVRGEPVSVREYLSTRAVAEAPLVPQAIVPQALVPQVIVKPPVVNSKPAIGNDGLIGRLTIPRLKLSVIVRQGVSKDTLTVAAGHIPGTALPGERGNVAVAGHRDTLFRGLRDIRKNDEIHFETLSGNYDYRVGSTEIVKPEDVGVLKAGPSPELTLVTCYPFTYIGSAPDRFIVKATQVTQVSTEAPEPEPAPAPRIIPVAQVKPKPVDNKITFVISKNHSRQLAPGISIGVSDTDMTCHCMNGWMWLMPERRTIWLRNQDTHSPVVFYGYRDGKRRELWLTNISDDSVAGYLLPPA